jgi:hypothetical protein
MEEFEKELRNLEEEFLREQLRARQAEFLLRAIEAGVKRSQENN